MPKLAMAWCVPQAQEIFINKRVLINAIECTVFPIIQKLRECFLYDFFGQFWFLLHPCEACQNPVSDLGGKAFKPEGVRC